MARPLIPKNKTLEHSRLTWQDGLLILAIITVILVIIRTASQLVGDYETRCDHLYKFRSTAKLYGPNPIKDGISLFFIFDF
ncbi:MAG: hypothetical protein RSE13_21700 [Planktothrix sp. GU0601_MAG3]|nr:MAG: hypothetical protein RSE13_21700 [Planktothrix sp. GU0601_MAG3]